MTMKSMEPSEVTIFVIHPIEGHVEHLQELAARLDATVYGLQCSRDVKVDSIERLAAQYIEVSVHNLSVLLSVDFSSIDDGFDPSCL